MLRLSFWSRRRTCFPEFSPDSSDLSFRFVHRRLVAGSGQFSCRERRNCARSLGALMPPSPAQMLHIAAHIQTLVVDIPEVSEEPEQIREIFLYGNSYTFAVGSKKFWSWVSCMEAIMAPEENFGNEAHRFYLSHRTLKTVAGNEARESSGASCSSGHHV